jgi:hypothetical protein
MVLGADGKRHMVWHPVMCELCDEFTDDDDTCYGASMGYHSICPNCRDLCDCLSILQERGLIKPNGKTTQRFIQLVQAYNKASP